MILVALIGLAARAAASPTDDADCNDDRAAQSDDGDDGDDAEDIGNGGDRDDDRIDGVLVEDDDIRRMIELAPLDAAAPVAIAGDVSFSAAASGAPESYEAWMRHQRPSRWGRLDVGVQWRRRWSEPMQAMSRRYDEVLLVATWRR